MSNAIRKESGLPLSGMAETGSFACWYCGHVCRSKIGLNSHIISKHERLDLPCPIEGCARTFYTPQARARHITSHDGFDDRFFAKVHMTSACWHWMGPLDSKGYAVVKIHHVQKQGHRVAYERIVGPIPEGLTLDHLCGRKNCVRPEHLEPVPHEINMLRWARRTNFSGEPGSQVREPIVFLVPSLMSRGSNTYDEGGA